MEDPNSKKGAGDSLSAGGRQGVGVPAKGDSSSSNVPLDEGATISDAPVSPPPRSTSASSKPEPRKPDENRDGTISDAPSTPVPPGPSQVKQTTRIANQNPDATISDSLAAARPSTAGQFVAGIYMKETILQPGDLLGARYEVLQLLGEGGMGAVYKAVDHEVDRIVALKLIRPELATNPTILARFKQELLTAHQVTHKNVIRIYDIGEADGVKFITMEFVEGQDLRHILTENGKLPIERSVEIIRQVCLALEAAHSAGIIHRDLKPQNIMQETKTGRILVMDFGLARTMGSEGMTQTGALLGTIEYMSPEQSMGKALDQRSDIFAVGLIFYEMLVGKTPYRADTAMASLLLRNQQRAIPAAELDTSIPKGLSEIVSKCLERDLEHRYQNVQEILADLDAFQGARPTMASIAIPVPAPVPVKREFPWKWVAFAALSVIALGGGYVARVKGPAKVKAPHAPVSVLVADFTNHTGDPIFDGTLEPMFNVALEGASFINAVNRGNARKLAEQLPHPTDKLDEQSARLVAVSQGYGSVVTGELSRRGDKYNLKATALDAVNGNVIAQTDISAANKDDVLMAIPKLAAPIRRALGDTTGESEQVQAAGGAFTAASLETVHDYGVGMEQQFSGNMQGAFQSFSKAAELDPNFARAYAGMAAVSRNMGKEKDAEKYIKLAMEHVDRMTERERYRIRGLYYVTAGDFPKCVEEYTSLVNLYPSDNLAHNNLAGCYAELRNYPKAIDELQEALRITPNSAMYRMNLSVYQIYVGDFQGAEQQVRKVLQQNPSYETAYIALAYAQMGQGQFDQAAQNYEAVGKLSPLGASIRASGLADIALYEGRFSDAARILETGAAADQAAKNSRAAEKYAILAYAQLASGHKGPALEAAKLALANTQKVNVRFLVARIYAEAGEVQQARTLATALSAELSPEALADSKLIEGELALHEKDPRKAIQSFTDANKILPMWMGWFDLGQAYLDAGLYVQANSEFDDCVKGRGQAMDLLDGPTYGIFPPVYYYLGRTEEGIGSPGAAKSYAQFVSIQGKGNGSALLEDAKKRVAQLTAKK